MTQEGFENYLYSVYDSKNGTAKSYITAIHIIDEMFRYDDVFGLNGTSVTCIEDEDLLIKISEFVYAQQSLYRKGEESIFSNISDNQSSYPGKGFCTAAVRQLLKYREYDKKENEAGIIVSSYKKGSRISKELVSFFKIDKVGSDITVVTNTRLGQGYFRKMVLANYGNRCCVTGLNIPQTLRASHIVGWAEDKRHRMNPENGLCLSATYDAAFDKHLISFDDDYRLIVSKEIKDYYTNEAAKEYFESFEGKRIELPLRFMPDKQLLERHRNLLVI